uniref:Uncharacterized protein n=1 Tax=Seriola lalandi dorsalis TaxID=1841481 RepID=A0A3B4WDS5_SERLL
MQETTGAGFFQRGSCRETLLRYRTEEELMVQTLELHRNLTSTFSFCSNVHWTLKVTEVSVFKYIFWAVYAFMTVLTGGLDRTVWVLGFYL